jgi:dihydropteroate synthase
MRIFGIVNVTPDSFSDGGCYSDVEAAVDHALRLEDEGAQVIDIGGESTRPGANAVDADEELRRVTPVVERLSMRLSADISVDTRRPIVASAAVSAGAVIWNDVSALTYDESSIEVASQLRCDVILMHAMGNQNTVSPAPQYRDVNENVHDYLKSRILVCEQAGIPRERLIADLGIGFGKTCEHNVALFQGLEQFQALGVRLMMAASRKRFIGELDRDGAARERIGGSLAAVLRAQAAGFTEIRVHDVAATRQALCVGSALWGRETNLFQLIGQ